MTTWDPAADPTAPTRWRIPKTVLVPTLPAAPDMVARMWATMARTPQQTYRVVAGDTATAGRLAGILRAGADALADHVTRSWAAAVIRTHPWPLPNVHVGALVRSAGERGDLDLIRAAPAVRRVAHATPLQGDLGELGLDGIHEFVVAGGRGDDAPPLDPAWVISIRDQCRSTGVRFDFAGWGEWAPAGVSLGPVHHPERLVGEPVDDRGHRQVMRRVGWRRARRDLAPTAIGVLTPTPGATR